MTAPGSSAEAIPFLKTWVNLPGAIGFTVLYSAMANRLGRQALFYSVLGPFLAFFGAFPLIYQLRGALHPVGLATWLAARLPAGFAAPIAVLRNWTYSLFYLLANMWGSVVVSLLFWGTANDVVTVPEAKKCAAPAPHHRLPDQGPRLHHHIRHHPHVHHLQVLPALRPLRQRRARLLRPVRPLRLFAPRHSAGGGGRVGRRTQAAHVVRGRAGRCGGRLLPLPQRGRDRAAGGGGQGGGRGAHRRRPEAQEEEEGLDDECAAPGGQEKSSVGADLCDSPASSRRAVTQWASRRATSPRRRTFATWRPS